MPTVAPDLNQLRLGDSVTETEVLLADLVVLLVPEDDHGGQADHQDPPDPGPVLHQGGAADSAEESAAPEMFPPMLTAGCGGT